MGLQADLTDEIAQIFTEQWDEQPANVVPVPTDLRLNSNHAKFLDTATIVYADIDGSTNMVDKKHWWFSANVYKAYLRCASRILKSEGGTIAAYDGDRVMAVFYSTSKNTSAVRAALKINGAVENFITPKIRSRYNDTQDFSLRHKIGIDSSPIRVVRIGVHADNDLVWIGRAANHAAKLCEIQGHHPLWITQAVHDNMNDVAKFAGNGDAMWQPYTWNEFDNSRIYGSSSHWTSLD